MGNITSQDTKEDQSREPFLTVLRVTFSVPERAGGPSKEGSRSRPEPPRWPWKDSDGRCSSKEAPRCRERLISAAAPTLGSAVLILGGLFNQAPHSEPAVPHFRAGARPGPGPYATRRRKQRRNEGPLQGATEASCSCRLSPNQFHETAAPRRTANLARRLVSLRSLRFISC